MDVVSIRSRRVPLAQASPWTLERLGAPAYAIVVAGIPGPQGSKRHLGRGILVESSKKVRPWREAVVKAVEEAREGTSWATLDLPVVMDLVFTMPRPQSAPKRRRALPDRRPDVDKLTRSTLDALVTARVMHEDSRVVAFRRLEKLYANDLEDSDALSHPGAVIRVWGVDTAALAAAAALAQVAS